MFCCCLVNVLFANQCLHLEETSLCNTTVRLRVDCVFVVQQDQQSGYSSQRHYLN